jgi:hypothetical protein
MNVEIGAEAALFPEKEYINGIDVAVQLLSHSGSGEDDFISTLVFIRIYNELPLRAKLGFS